VSHTEINAVVKLGFINQVYAPRCCGAGNGLKSVDFLSEARVVIQSN